MHARRENGTGVYLFEAMFQASNKSGLYGYAIRVLPRECEYMGAFCTGLIKWADRQAQPITDEQPVLV
jgi:hypothetical protein